MVKRLTPEKLREYSGFEHFTDEETREIIDQLERLSYIMVSMSLEREKIKQQLHPDINDNDGK